MRLTGRLLLLAAVACLAPMSPAPAAAQTLADYDYENLQFRGIGPEIGWVVPSELERTISYGMHADLGFVGPNVRIVPSIRFWASELRQPQLDRLSEQIVHLCEKQATECPALNLGEVQRSDLELSTEAHYIFAPWTPISLYAGGGLSLHLLNGRGELIDDTFVEDLLDTVAPGFSLLFGSFIPVGKIRLVGEARAVLTSDVQYGNLTLGGVWSLPSPPRPADAR
ncbi:MAG: hypothetical protein KY464_14435 [Gemmatimonadetes bacterium]|nr:hypothetical protein [Gemmatimonadota bacterium]